MNLTHLEHDLRTYRPAGMEHLPADFVWPRYEGLCVGNLAATITHALGVETPPQMLPPLRADLLNGMLDDVRRVILIVVDAMGWIQVQRVMAQHPDLVFHKLAERGRVLPITTTFLSTTNSVLSAIWTGRPPLEHGLLAYELFLREWLMVVESIGFSSPHEPFRNTLLKWDFDPEAFLPVPALFETLAAWGVPADALIYNPYTTTPLSKMHFRGAREVRGHAFASEFWLMLRKMVEEHRGERCVLGGYLSAVDNLAHRFGPEDETGEVEILSLAMMMDEIFLKRLQPEDREGTLLLMTADHGQITTRKEDAVVVDDHPALRDALLFRPVGESRVPFLHTRGGQRDAVGDYLREHLSDAFTWLAQDEFLASGLLGPGTPHPEIAHRLGDYIGLSHEKRFIAKDAEGAKKPIGRHGGMHPSEMLVPLMAVRLDG